MLKLLSDGCILRINKALFLYRCKSDLAVYQKRSLKTLNNDETRNFNRYLLKKIYYMKDEDAKQKLVKAIMNINSARKFNYSNIDMIMKSKVKNLSSNVEDNVIINCNSDESKLPSLKEAEANNPAEKNEFSRPIRRDTPGEVIWGFIPKEWASFFIPITGYSGFYTLLVTFGTYLFSKEIYVCDHDYYNGISLAILCIYVVKTYGPTVANMLDKEIDAYEQDMNKWKEQCIQNLKDAIVFERKSQESMEGQMILVDAKRENVQLQREAEYRRRQMEVYEDVTRILNYHVENERVRKMIQHKNLVQWVTKEVEKNLTPELKEKFMKLCLADIKEILEKNTK